MRVQGGQPKEPPAFLSIGYKIIIDGEWRTVPVPMNIRMILVHRDMQCRGCRLAAYPHPMIFETVGEGDEECQIGTKYCTIPLVKHRLIDAKLYMETAGGCGVKSDDWERIAHIYKLEVEHGHVSKPKRSRRSA